MGSKDDEIADLNSQVNARNNQIDEFKKHIRNLEHEIKKRDYRIDALLYNLVMNQKIIRHREDELREYEAKDSLALGV